MGDYTIDMDKNVQFVYDYLVSMKYFNIEDLQMLSKYIIFLIERAVNSEYKKSLSDLLEFYKTKRIELLGTTASNKCMSCDRLADVIYTKCGHEVVCGDCIDLSWELKTCQVCNQQSDIVFDTNVTNVEIESLNSDLVYLTLTTDIPLTVIKDCTGVVN